MDPAELFANLDANQPSVADESKTRIHQMLNATREAWLLNGIFDYYLATNSARCIEILVCVREPHDKHLFDKLSEAIKGQSKLQALTVLGHVLRKQPGWLYKITQHQLLKDLLKLLKTECDILPLLSGLLAIVVLLPMIPSLIGPFLQEIFDVFTRLAAWNFNPGRLAEEQLVHLQVALYALFLRLYGMYPCNFITYLRNHYRHADNRAVFAHTVRPMLNTVLVHPYLITASLDNETEAVRWKKMGHHDVIVQCESFAVDAADRSGRDDPGLMGCGPVRPRSVTDEAASPFSIQPFRCPPMTPTGADNDEFWSPSVFFQYHSNSPPPLTESSAPTSIPQTPNSVVSLGTGIAASPPEAAIEATPETTPIKDLRALRSAPPVNSAVARALNSLGSGPAASKWPSLPSGTSTPSTSQPSSPMKKDASPFKYPTAEGSAFELSIKRPIASQKIARVLEDRTLAAAQQMCVPPTSPLRPIHRLNDPEGSPIRGNSPAILHQDSTQEDQEVLEIVRRGEHMSRPSAITRPQCDSIIQEFQVSHDDEYDDCEQEHGSPCTSGGLHMPNSHSLQAFASRVKRLRYYSQCAPEPTKMRNGRDLMGSPSLPPNIKVRRANSCPEMKKNFPNAFNTETTKGPLDESDELSVSGSNSTPVPDKHGMSNGLTSTASIGTQTLDLWPMPYEHLFLGIFPIMEMNAEIRPSPAPSPAPCQQTDKQPVRFSPYEMLDKYIEQAAHVSENNDQRQHVKVIDNEVKSLREQLALLHLQLQYERHRREVHAFRNRRLLGESRTNKGLEEHNSALRDQLALLQKEIESLHGQLENKRQDSTSREREMQQQLEYWHAQCLFNSEENNRFKDECDKVKKELLEQKRLFEETVEKYGKTEAKLFQMESEMNVALAQARDSQRLAAELDRTRTELLLAGELNQRFRERLAAVGGDAASKIEDEKRLLTATYHDEIRLSSQQLESKTAQVDAYRSHIAELESAAKDYDDMCASQKRMLKEVKDEYHEQLRSVESKYETQRSVNKCMEERFLELWQKIETLKAAQRRPVHNSPDTSSCHEAMVSASMASGPTSHIPLSPHSSPPLSASLASSEGSMRAFLLSSGSNIDQNATKEIKNLQVIVNREQRLSSEETTPDGGLLSPASNSD